MYTLADYVGEDKINLALHNFLMQYRYANAHNQTDAVQHESGASAENQPYPDTRLLVDGAARANSARVSISYRRWIQSHRAL